MSYCSKVYPFGPTVNFMPLYQKPNTVPSTYSGTLARRSRQLNSNVIYNIDGRPIKFNPCRYRCSLSHLDSVKPVFWQVGQAYTTLGGIVTAPAYYVQCGGGVGRA